MLSPPFTFYCSHDALLRLIPLFRYRRAVFAARAMLLAIHTASFMFRRAIPFDTPNPLLRHDSAFRCCASACRSVTSVDATARERKTRYAGAFAYGVAAYERCITRADVQVQRVRGVLPQSDARRRAEMRDGGGHHHHTATPQRREPPTLLAVAEDMREAPRMRRRARCAADKDRAHITRCAATRRRLCHD